MRRESAAEPFGGPMSLAERLNAAKKPSKSAFEQWIDTLSEADQEALIAAAKDPELSNAAIVEAVRAEGYSAHRDTIARWRKGHGFTR
jgi:hypothetical protein